MSVTNIRVRTTCSSLAPAWARARSMFLMRLHGLGIGIAGSDDLSLGVGGRGAGDVDPIADPHGPRIADDRFPGTAGGEVLTLCHG